MMIDGGISSPSVPAPASDPIDIIVGYPRLASSGRLILPMVAQVAALDPETAAKMAQPTTLVCRRRPGRCCIQGARPRNMSWLRRVRNRISPIQMKSGRAVSVQLADEPQIVTAIASPAGRELKSCMPIQATPERIRNSETTSSAVIAKSLIAAGLVADRNDTHAANLEHQLVDEGD